MAKFRIINDPPKHYMDQAWVFNDEFFTVDTAERLLVDTWYQKNGKNMIYALQGEEVLGFFCVIPLTEEAGKLFAHNTIREEDIEAHHILEPDAMPYAQSLYVAAIAVKNPNTIIGNQCVAALMAGLCDRICNGYQPEYLKHIFVNPTTFEGNRFIRKMGMEPVRTQKNGLRAGNNIYSLALGEDSFEHLCATEERYRRFVSAYEWQ